MTVAEHFCVEDWVASTQRLLGPLGAQQVPPSFASATSEGRAALEMGVHRSGIGRFGELRVFRATGARVGILSVFLVPNPALALPLYCMEIVVLGSKVAVAVMDLPVLDASRATELRAASWMRNTLKAHPGHVPADDPPAWFSECRSGHDLFERPGLSDLPRLRACHLHVVETWMREANRAAQVDDVVGHTHGLGEYLAHHAHHSPGRPLLMRSKGKAWTDALLDQWMFGPVRSESVTPVKDGLGPTPSAACGRGS